VFGTKREKAVGEVCVCHFSVLCYIHSQVAIDVSCVFTVKLFKNSLLELIDCCVRSCRFIRNVGT
jgi:hypothetical protein